MGFILRFEESLDTTQFEINTVAKMRAHVAAMFPPNLHYFAWQHSKASMELLTGLQNSYQAIFPLPDEQITAEFIPQAMREDIEFVKYTQKHVRKLHDILLQIRLTPGLDFGSEVYDPDHIKCPMGVAKPIVILPPLVHEGEEFTQGYAY